jgi:hypothetical protein
LPGYDTSFSIALIYSLIFNILEIFATIATRLAINQGDVAWIAIGRETMLLVIVGPAIHEFVIDRYF